jgi:predicted metal-dependent hydrolase
MNDTIDLAGISVSVTRKPIKNLHLSVYPPTGVVRISAPERMSLDTIRIFTISKLGWLRDQQHKIRTQERETPREYLDRESHYLWGNRYLLKLVEKESAPAVELRHRTLVLQVRPRTDEFKKEAILADWYREQLKQAVPPLIARWEPLLDVRVNRIFVQHMKTRWGSCNHHAAHIRLNSELAKKPRQCLEYVLLHEMLHLLEPTHNKRFIALMDQCMPEWRTHRDMLNRLPVRHEKWVY